MTDDSPTTSVIDNPLRAWPIEQHGHSFYNWNLYPASEPDAAVVRRVDMFMYDGYGLTPEIIERIDPIKRAISSGEPVQLPRKGQVSCRGCGSRDLMTDGRRVYAPASCLFDGSTPLTVQFAFPSGRMIVANELRPLFDGFMPVEDKRYFSTHCLNYPAGRVATTTDAAADHDVLLFFAGNTSPSVYRQPDGSLQISQTGWDADTEQEIEPQGEEVAEVITDLWWVSICDGDDFDRRLADAPEPFTSDYTEVPVTPGVWTWTYYAHMVGPSPYTDAPSVLAQATYHDAAAS